MVKKECRKESISCREALPKGEIQGDRCRNRRPHTCRGGNRRNSIPDGSPIPSCSPAENNGVCSCRKNSRFSYNRRSVFPLLRSSPDRSAVTGKRQKVWINQTFLNRTIQELLMIELENKGKRIFRFEFPAFQQRKKFGCGTGRIAGSFLAFLFSLGWFYFRETVFRGKVVPVFLPDAGKEIIKSPNAGSIPERETAEDGIKRSFRSIRHQTVMEVTFSFSASR